jgi:hypothetical protein
MFVWALWLLVFAAAGAAIFAEQLHTRDQNPQALIATRPALNSTVGSYQVGPIDVGLLKVVRLPHNQIGMQFVLHSTAPLGNCCSLFPRLATGEARVAAGDARFATLLVVEQVSDFSRSGTLDMSLVNSDPSAPFKEGFTVDLRALHVTGIGG